MSKIVCDVCGSSYSENEIQCPICGTARSEGAKPVVETTVEEQPVKGGKFSRENNRKNTAARQSAGERGTKSETPAAPSNLAMIIIVAVLLLAIVVVCVFIGLRYVDKSDPSDTTTTQSPNVEPEQVPCTGIELVNGNTITLTTAGQSAQIEVAPVPANTTDEILLTYRSANPDIATVDENGLVTAVERGTTTITVSYGTYSLSVDVTCDIYVELVLAYEEVTLNANSTTVDLYKTSALDRTEITWETSDANVATVDENGRVTAVANGNATITATFDTQSVTCKIHVSGIKNTFYKLRNQWNKAMEATMVVGEKLEIWLYDSRTDTPITEGVTWTTSGQFGQCCSYAGPDAEGHVTITANATSGVSDGITGGYIFIRATYEGESYDFIIRVKAAETEE